MRGIPRTIATPADLDYMFQLATVGKQLPKKMKPAAEIAQLMDSFVINDRNVMAGGALSREPLTADVVFTEVFPAGRERTENEFAECLRRMLAQQYHRVRIISVDGNKVTTMYFPEITSARRTEDGHEVVTYEHIEASEDSEERIGEDGMVYDFTVISLSAPPFDPGWLSVHMPDNQLTRSGFDPAKIQNMLEVLTNA